MEKRDISTNSNKKKVPDSLKGLSIAFMVLFALTCVVLIFTASFLVYLISSGNLEVANEEIVNPFSVSLSFSLIILFFVLMIFFLFKLMKGKNWARIASIICFFILSSVWFWREFANSTSIENFFEGGWFVGFLFLFFPFYLIFSKKVREFFK